MPPPRASAFTLTATGNKRRALETPCEASPAFDPALPQNQWPQMHTFRAIWDTGATASVITATVVQACGLKPTGMARVQGVHGVEDAETYLVNFRLPNRVGFQNVKVTLGKIQGTDILIGMDIINRGDFTISNVGGKTTVFSFRYPSMETVDYVKDVQTQAAGAQSQSQRNAQKRQRKANKHKKKFNR